MAVNQSLGSDSLEKLQSSKQIALLDAIDKLRNQGVNHYDISLPQLIVCGDQSSGKSSVLQGLTRLRFPTDDGTCTTFATELVLRKESDVSISCSIFPGRERSNAQKRELTKFEKSYTSRDDFAFDTLVEAAKTQMAFGNQSVANDFFDDILKIRYAGPDLPSLTIVDLPGIIQSQIGGQKEEGVKQVHSLIDRYMHDERSIILAVVSAQNDLENQAVFKKIKEKDPLGCRSLGIITKPDKLEPGSASEARCMALAQNQIMRLDLGWHMVKNRGFGMREQTDAERDQSERDFFARTAWAPLPRSDVGIDNLRMKLSEVLLRHICKELPRISASINEAIAATESKLDVLGNPRQTPEQLRFYLTKNAERFQRITDSALGGVYNDPFFKASFHLGYNATRLRTEIQNLNIAFAYTLHRKGHTWEIEDDTSIVNADIYSFSSQASQHYEVGFEDPERISRSRFLDEYIGTYVQESRQSGLPSLVNPWVIGEVFRNQSERWEDIAVFHLKSVYQAVDDYIHVALETLLDPRTFHKLQLEHVQPELKSKKAVLDAKLQELLRPYKEQDPTTYDPSFVYELNELRAKRYVQDLDPNDANNPSRNPRRRSTSRRHLLTESIDDYTNSEILDLMQAYYKRAVSVFINNVAMLAVENCLIAGLAEVFSPSFISAMNEEKLHLIASESDEVVSERVALSERLKDLRRGKRVLDVQACDTQSTLPNQARTRQSLPLHRSRARPSTPHNQQQRSQSNYTNVQGFETASEIERLIGFSRHSPREERWVNTPTPSVTPTKHILDCANQKDLPKIIQAATPSAFDWNEEL